MDRALLREREAFKRKAMSQPAVENKRSSASSSSSKAKAAAQLGAQSQSAKAKLDLAQMKSMSGGSSQFKFGVLAKIVRHMKSRHMEGEDHPLNLDEILDETNQTDVGNKTKLWLQTDALKNNPKISASPDGTYLYKAPYSIVNKKGLLKLLRQHDLKGLGGIFLEDIQESLPKYEKVIRSLTEENKIIVVNRAVDKKKVVFYHDHTSDFVVDDEFQKLWRSVAVDSLDDAKIDEYLEKQGIRTMQDLGLKRQSALPARMRKKASGAKRKNRAPRDNEHLKEVLVDYTETDK